MEKKTEPKSAEEKNPKEILLKFFRPNELSVTDFVKIMIAMEEYHSQFPKPEKPEIVVPGEEEILSRGSDLPFEFISGANWTIVKIKALNPDFKIVEK